MKYVADLAVRGGPVLASTVASASRLMRNIHLSIRISISSTLGLALGAAAIMA